MMTKTYDLSGRPKGPPRISKLDTIVKQMNKVNSAFDALDKDKDGMVTKKDFENKRGKSTPLNISTSKIK